MSNRSAQRKSRPETPNIEGTHVTPIGTLPQDIQRPLIERGKGDERKFSCVPIKESDHFRISMRMSPESRKISNGTKWSETGYIPSFVNTDKILMKSARRTYITLGLFNRWVTFFCLPEGDIVVIPFPFSDLSQVKRRPAFRYSKCYWKAYLTWKPPVWSVTNLGDV